MAAWVWVLTRPGRATAPPPSITPVGLAPSRAADVAPHCRYRAAIVDEDIDPLSTEPHVPDEEGPFPR